MSKRKLLLADDSITIQKVINLTFADEGVEVVTCGDGDSALEKIAAESPDLIMADVHMPGANGYRICETVRADPATAATPVILLVGSFEPFDENEALRVGATTVMTKPFSSIRQLVNQVMELMEAAGAGGQMHDPEADIPTIVPNAETLHFPSDEAASTPSKTEMDDIESLYHQSLSNEPRPDPSVSETIEFDEIGMDDELVEESYPSGRLPAEDTAETTEYAAADEHIQQQNEAAADEGSERSEAETAASEDKTLELPTPVFEDTIDRPGDAPIYYDLASGETDAADATGQDTESARPELGIAEEMAAAEPEIHRPEDTTEEPSAGNTDVGFDLSELPTEEPVFENEPERAESPFETGPLDVEEREEGRFEFDEIDLLDLPDLEDLGPIELSTPERSISSGSMAKAVSLSPELIDMIVERVIERLRREDQANIN